MKYIGLLSLVLFIGCQTAQVDIKVFQTSAGGDKLTEVGPSVGGGSSISLTVDTTAKYQQITGFGGSFTESSAYLLNRLSQENRDSILDAYFSESGANYSLTRTHIASSDFSLEPYSYAMTPGDTLLQEFSIEEDMNDIIPMIKDAQRISKDGFKIIASPWTAPPWMKDNNSWKGGKLRPEYYQTWALFMVKYLKAYAAQGIDIWGITVENEPLGNGAQWESMHYSPQEMAVFVKEYLAPALEEADVDLNVLLYDQNRDHLVEWAEVFLKDKELLPKIYGMAIHWYASTYKVYPDELSAVHEMAPEKHIIETEGCIDAEVPKWRQDAWYWQKEATDWGYDWAPEEQKADHPKYVPVYRYARDIIGCLNNWVEGWVDWNMVLDRQGGPNWAKNWCIAPVIVDPDADEVYFTPLYYTMSHFSKFIRPGATRIGLTIDDEKLMATAATKDGEVILVVLNMTKETKTIVLPQYEGFAWTIAPQALQTITIN